MKHYIITVNSNEVANYFRTFNKYIVNYIEFKYGMDTVNKYNQYVNKAGILDIYERFILWLYDKNLSSDAINDNEIIKDIRSNLREYIVMSKKVNQELKLLNLKHNDVIALLHEFINKYLIEILK